MFQKTYTRLILLLTAASIFAWTDGNALAQSRRGRMGGVSPRVGAIRSASPRSGFSGGLRSGSPRINNVAPRNYSSPTFHGLSGNSFRGGLGISGIRRPQNIYTRPGSGYSSCGVSPRSNHWGNGPRNSIGLGAVRYDRRPPICRTSPRTIDFSRNCGTFGYGGVRSGYYPRSHTVAFGSTCSPGYYRGQCYTSVCNPFNYYPSSCGFNSYRYGYSSCLTPYWYGSIGYPGYYGSYYGGSYLDYSDAFDPYVEDDASYYSTSRQDEPLYRDDINQPDDIANMPRNEPHGLSELLKPDGPQPRVYERVKLADGSWAWMASEGGTKRSWQLLQDMEQALRQGDAAFDKGDYSSAHDAYVRALVAASDDSRTRIALGISDFARGRYGDAWHAVLRGMSDSPSTYTFFNVRDAYGRPRDFDKHIAALRVHLRQHPKDDDAKALLNFVQDTRQASE